MTSKVPKEMNRSDKPLSGDGEPDMAPGDGTTMDPDFCLSDERYRAFIENIDEGVYETDGHGNFTYFNSALCKVFGFPREEIQGVGYSKRGVTDLLWEIIDKKGKTRNIELSANLIVDSLGKKIGFRGIARDVTERHQTQQRLRESEKRYRVLLDFMPYPVVVFAVDGRVSYLNPAFTDVFGWTLAELQGKRIPYVPPDLAEETKENIKRLMQEKIILRIETRRLTKGGRVLDVIMRGAVFSTGGDEPDGSLIILRDITHEKRMARNNEALLKISMALPAYPDLEDLLDYISNQVKQLLNAGGALVILLDEIKQEFFFLGAAYDDTATQKRVKKIRYSVKNSAAGRVLTTGKPLIVEDTSKTPYFSPVVDRRSGSDTRNLLAVPLRSSDRIFGVLMALNKKEGIFDQADTDLMNMIEGTVSLSIENARFSEEVKEAYREVSSLNKAKDKVINHLSHELKTPVSVLLASLNILTKKLDALPEETWKQTIERAHRNLERILEIQYEVEDIMQDKEFRIYGLLSMLLDQCADELESLVAEEVGEGEVVEGIRKRIEDLFGPKEAKIFNVSLPDFLKQRLDILKPRFSHRQVDITTDMGAVSEICIPKEVLEKVFDGLLKNAVENTPDGGKIDIQVRGKGEGVELVVHDYGVGITEENQRRLFEGFFTTQETMAYSSKRPFDFNAGGKGADLLRMKIFSERYNFIIKMESSRCGFIPKDSDVCPGEISECRFCDKREVCHGSGGTVFTLFFSPAPDVGCEVEAKS
ncbi:MAG: PAS domain S-box protein [Deltaproteobacteria bacterium]|nr:PAS domain S-box protein [Deltaproteobacteria bacterium]